MAKKKNALASEVSRCRLALDDIHTKAIGLLTDEIKRAGGTVALATRIGRSESYIRMIKIRGTNAVLRCLDEIAKEGK